MKIFRDFEEIIDFAIERELDEIQFYSELILTMESDSTKLLFRNLSVEKVFGIMRLENMKKIGVLLDIESLPDLKISGTFSEIDFTKVDLSNQAVLLMAMNKEKEKFILYQELANLTTDIQCKQILKELANQEASQKLKLEIKYDEFVLCDN